MSSRSHSARSLLGTVVLALVLTACDDPPPTSIARATFIEAYVALREATLRAPDGELTPTARDSILEARELTPQDLLDFVEVHGRDPIFMGRVWEEIDTEMAVRSRAAGQAASGVS